MKTNKLIAAISLLIICIFANAQSVQYGYTEEYRGANEKRPLSGVNIMAGGSSTKSGSGGKFKLEFNTLKVGDKVNADINSVAILKGYVLFNKEAVEQWTVSGKSVYFRIVLCKQKDFEAMVKNYYNVSDKSYREQLRKERERADKLKRDGEIQQQEYERLLNEAEERYNRAFQSLRENAEMVARIDESELEGNQAEILRLAKEGKLDKAVELIRESNTDELLDNARQKRIYAIEQKQYFEQKETEAQQEVEKLISRLKDEIKVLKLAGGKESFDLCAEKWIKIAETDTTDIKNVYAAADFFWDQKEYQLAEKYFVMAINECEQLYKDNPEGYRVLYSTLLNGLGTIYYSTYRYDDSESLLLKALDIYKTMAEANPDAYNFSYASVYNNLGNLYVTSKQYYKVEECFRRSLEIHKSMAEKNPDKHNDQYESTLCNLGIFYGEIGQADKAEACYMQALTMCKTMAAKDPDAYNINYATALQNIGALYKTLQQWDKAEQYFVQSISIYESLVEKNPSAYNYQYAKTIVGLGDVFLGTNRKDKSIEYYNRALNILKQLAESNPAAYNTFYVLTMIDLGCIYSESQQHDKAEEYFKAAYTLLKPMYENNNDAYAADYSLLLMNMGVTYLNLGDFENAEKFYLQTLNIRKSLAEKSPNEYSLAYSDILFNLGCLYFTVEDYPKVEEYFVRSLNILKPISEKDPDISNIKCSLMLGVLSSCNILSKHFIEAKQYGQEALSIDSTLSWVKLNIVCSLLFQGKYTEAETIAIKIKDEVYEGTVLGEGVLDELNIYEEKGIIPEEWKDDVERLRSVLKNHKSDKQEISKQ